MWRSIHVGLVVAVGLAAIADDPKQDAKKLPYERLLAGKDAAKAKNLATRAKTAEAAENYDEAIRLNEELLELRTTVQGDHWESTDQRWELKRVEKLASISPERRAAWRKATGGLRIALELADKGQAANAERLCRDSLQFCLEVLGEKHPDTAESYNHLGYNLNAQAKYGDAHPLYQKALDLRLELLGENHPATAESYNNVAYNLHAQGKYGDAQPLYEKCLDRNRAIHGEKHVATARTYDNLAQNLSGQGLYVDAQLLAQKALNLRIELLGEKHADTAKSYNTLANVLEELGKYADAQPLFQKALDLMVGLFGEKHVYTATSYNNLAANLSSQAKSAEAQLLYQKTLHVLLEVLGHKHPYIAGIHSNLGMTLNTQGKYADAQPLFQKALDLNLEVLGDKHPNTVMSYNNLAHNLNAQKKYADAQSLFEQALNLHVELLGDKHPNTALSYNNLAGNLNAQKKYADAQPLVQKGLDLHVELFGEKHPLVAGCYNNLAGNLHAQKKYADASRFYQKALELRIDLLGEKHRSTAESYLDQAYNLAAQGKHSCAQERLALGAAAYESARLTLARRGLDRAIFGAQKSPYGFLACIQATLQSSAAAWGAAEMNLARGLSDESASRRGATLSASELEQQGELSAKLSELQPRILQLVSKLSQSDAEKDELFKLHSERSAIENQLAALAVSRSQRELAPLAAVQSAIPANAALLLWVDVTSPGVEEHWGCVVRRTGDPAWERLPGTGAERPSEAETLESELQREWTDDDSALPAKLREALVSRTSAAPEVHALAKALDNQRIAPLAQHLDGVKSLYVIAVNEMAGVPVDALTQDYTISYVPSGTFLARLKDKSPPGGTGLLALGDPIFSGADAKSKPATDLPPGGLLITQVAPDGGAAKARLQPGDVLVRYGDTELTSIEELTTAIQVHAAAKEIPITVWRQGEARPFPRSVPPGRLGVVLDKEPAREAIANRRKSEAMLLALRGGDWRELPGTRSEITQLAKLVGPGTTTLLDSAASEQSLDELRSKEDLSKFRYLHFATHGEANNVRALESVLVLSQDKLPETPLPRAGEPFINGQLSANEVLEYWTLDAELVTLSACETALGREGGGDGLLGFAQAFLTAGSRAVCLSLWKVDDTATALLMTRFYQNLLGKRSGLDGPMPKAAALAESKQWLRELSAEEALTLTATATNGVVRGSRGKDENLKLVVPAVDPDQSAAKDTKPFAHPRYWSAFILIGDPN